MSQPIYHNTQSLNGENGASGTHTLIVDANRYHRMSVQLVSTGTINTTVSGGWTISFSNGPLADNSPANVDTTTFGWVDSGLTIADASGSASDQMVFISNLTCKWVRIQWTVAGSGAGNVSCAVFGGGAG